MFHHGPVASTPILKLQGVSKSYAGEAGAEVPVLQDINWEAAAGESIAIVGPSGSGKSTLLQILGTLDRPTAGTVSLEGKEWTGLDDRALAHLRNQRIGFVFQAHYLLPQCTVLENVLIPTLPLAGNPSEAETRARSLLDRVGLSHRADHLPGRISGGERQRAAVVRALINQPALVLADEPTGALDRASADRLGDLLVELNRDQSLTLIVVTHSLELAARMSRRFELKDGRLQ